jgi:hypothetical protein
MSGMYCGRVRVAVLVTAGLLFASVGAAGDPGASMNLNVENDSLDLGRVIAGSTATATFVFHNDGAHDIKILRAAPS